MFVPLQPFPLPMTALPGVIVAATDGVSGTASGSATVGVSYGLGPADAGHGMAAGVASVGWTGALFPADARHALSGEAARVVRALAPTMGPGRVMAVRGEAHATGVPLS